MKRTIETKIVNNLVKKYGLPKYATPGAAAMDLVACIESPVELCAGKHVLIGTGIAINLQDPSLAAMVASRSGLALKHQVRVSQGLGVIDSDYHGEIKVILQNDGDSTYTIQPGERIAQLVFMPVVQVMLNEVDNFSTVTERGEGGFGHTGKI